MCKTAQHLYIMHAYPACNSYIMEIITTAYRLENSNKLACVLRFIFKSKMFLILSWCRHGGPTELAASLWLQGCCVYVLATVSA